MGERPRTLDSVKDPGKVGDTFIAKRRASVLCAELLESRSDLIT